MRPAYLSVSQLKCFMSCSEQYHRRYVLHQEKANYTRQESLILGSAVHHYIECDILNRLNGRIPEHFFLDEILEKYENDRMEPTSKEAMHEAYVTFKGGDKKLALSIMATAMKPEHAEILIVGPTEELKTGSVHRPSYLDIYEAIIALYIESKKTLLDGIEIEAAEKEVQYELAGLPIKAYFDLYGYKDGRATVIDWKTYSRAKTTKEMTSLQDLIYSALVYREEGVIPLFLYNVFSFSDKTGKIRLQRFSIEYDLPAIEEVERQITSISAMIDSGAHTKNEQSFLCTGDYCEFYADCQAYREHTEIKEIA